MAEDDIFPDPKVGDYIKGNDGTRTSPPSIFRITGVTPKFIKYGHDSRAFRKDGSVWGAAAFRGSFCSSALTSVFPTSVDEVNEIRYKNKIARLAAEVNRLVSAQSAFALMHIEGPDKLDKIHDVLYAVVEMFTPPEEDPVR